MSAKVQVAQALFTYAPAPKLASKIPKKTRQTINPAIFWAAPEQVAAMPHRAHKQAT